MALLDTTRTPATGPVFGGLFANTFGTLKAWNDARQTRRALGGLTDRELDDIGLNRGDVDAIAYQPLLRG